MPSNTTELGSEPSVPRTSSAPARSAQIANCSAAAARNVSAATTSTRLRLARSALANLPIEVVFPLPFTPTTRMTAGGFANANPALGKVRKFCTSRLKRAIT